MKISQLFTFLLILCLGMSCGDDNADAENLIHYDGENFSSPILPPGLNEAAAFFPSSVMAPHDGRKIKTIEYFVYDLPVSASMKIYAEGSNDEPGNILYQSDLSISGMREQQWNFHVLSSPLELDGEGIWVSFVFENAASQQTMGCDEGPADNRGGDWLNQSTDGDWLTFRARTGDSINWNIRAEVED